MKPKIIKSPTMGNTIQKTRIKKLYFLLLFIVVQSLLIANESFAKKFVLTHCLGKKLPKSAYFYVDGDYWTLDYRNGDKIHYTVKSGSKANILCNIKTIDSNGDRCSICITPNNGNATIEFVYNAGTLTYTGYYEK